MYLPSRGSTANQSGNEVRSTLYTTIYLVVHDDYVYPLGPER